MKKKETAPASVGSHSIASMAQGGTEVEGLGKAISIGPAPSQSAASSL